MIEELSLVRLKKALPDADIPLGSIGTVVMKHQASPPAYEIEFFDTEGNTLRDSRTGYFTFTTSDDYVEPVDS